MKFKKGDKVIIKSAHDVPLVLDKIDFDGKTGKVRDTYANEKGKQLLFIDFDDNSTSFIPFDEVHVKHYEDPRILALGWMYAECCSMLDKGKDPRKETVPILLQKAIRDLGWEDLKR